MNTDTQLYAADLLEAISAGGQVSRAAAVRAAIGLDELAASAPSPEVHDAAAVVRLCIADQLDTADRQRALYLSLFVGILRP